MNRIRNAIPGRLGRLPVELVKIDSENTTPFAADDAPSDIAEDVRTWSNMPAFEVPQRLASRNRLILESQNQPARGPIDMLRTKVARILKQNGWTSLAVSSPGPGCGKTTLAINLAFSLSRQSNYRVVLVDLDLRHPRVGQRLGLPADRQLLPFLRRTVSIRDAFLRYGANLAVAPNSAPVPGASEILQDPLTGAALADMRDRLKPDVVIFDMPPMLASDDLMAFLPWVDSVLLVAAAGKTTLAEIDVCERDVSANTNLLGVVLNKCRYTPQRYGY